MHYHNIERPNAVLIMISRGQTLFVSTVAVSPFTQGTIFKIVGNEEWDLIPKTQVSTKRYFIQLSDIIFPYSVI